MFNVVHIHWPSRGTIFKPFYPLFKSVDDVWSTAVVYGKNLAHQVYVFFSVPDALRGQFQPTVQLEEVSSILKMGLTYILYASGFHKALSTQSLSYFTQVGPSTATGRGWFSVVDMEVENWSNSENKSRKSIDDLLNLQVWWFLAAIACICVVEINLNTVNVGNNGRADCE